jgi:phospho-N-acetylmuramoyl-pentapeptide-transferase
MLYWLFYSLQSKISFFNVFRYITVRSALAALTSLIFSAAVGPFFIRKLRQLKILTRPREYIPGRQRREIPTMGGVLIITAILLAVLAWSDLNNRFVLLTIFSFLWLGLLGAIDDYLKVRFQRGLRAKYKLLGQLLLGVTVGVYLFIRPPEIGELWKYRIVDSNYHGFTEPSLITSLTIPIFKKVLIELSFFYLAFVPLVIIASSNAVNLTDGVDGLAIGCVVFVAMVYGAFTYLVGNWKSSQYLNILFVEGVGELTVFCSALVGAGLGFLWFNSYPASIIMGDTGALSLGGIIGVIACLIKQEVILILVGGIFVAEALSVVLQVGAFKLKRRRIFAMTPLHHHFELKGWAEPQITVRFWIIAIILCILSLITLKVR